MDEQLAAIAERELGARPERVGRVAEGLRHETYELDFGDSSYVLQFASPAADDCADSLARGLGCYRLLADTAVPVPGVVTAEPREFEGRIYTLVEKLPGESGERALTPARTRNAARCLARVHESRRFDAAGWLRFADGEPSVREFPAGSPAREAQHSLARSARILRDGGLASAADAVESTIDRADVVLPEEFQPVCCHGDFTPDNVLFRDDDVTGVLDFDRSYAGWAARDLALAATSFWMHDPCADWDVRGGFLAGYRTVREPGGGFGRAEPLLRVETLAWVVAGLLAMDELSDYEREFYADALVDAAERVGEE